MSGNRGSNSSVSETRGKDIAAKYFNCSDDQRAVFEAGIKLGTIYHQYVGCPVSYNNVDVLEKAIEEGTKIQPFVDDVKVNIDRTRLKMAKSKKGYKYVTLTGNMLHVWLKVSYGSAVAICELKYLEDMDYTLMMVKEVSQRS
jgi:hypothetical protein